MGKTGQILKTQRISRNTCRKKLCSYEFQSDIAKFVNLLFRKASMGIYRVTSAYFLHSIRHWKNAGFDYGEQCGDSLKSGRRTAIWRSNPTPGHTHWGNQNWKRHMYPNVHQGTVYNSQGMEATSMSISRQMDKKAVIHIQNGILLSH